jgi:hypothetical protein
MVYLVEMESGLNFHLSYKHRTQRICFEISHLWQTIFGKEGFLLKITNSVAELTFFPHEVISKANLCGTYMKL